MAPSAKRDLRSYIELILKSGNESWTLSKLVNNYVKFAENWFCRRMTRTQWATKVNEIIYKEVNSQREHIFYRR